MIRLILYILPVFMVAQAAYSQQGCTDPQAANYDPQAVTNDGSCIYTLTQYSAPVITAITGVDETSGLTYAFGRLWTHDDSGGAPELYALDTVTGMIVQKLVLKNAVNTDWEDITTGNGKIFVGDFGNNAGSRTDLRIYMIDSAQWNGPVDSVDAQVIYFSYPDQSDFSGSNPAHNFDCEAMTFYGDTIILYTKNHGNQWTKRYTIPAVAGTHVASLTDSFPVNGLITGACQWADSLVILCGYEPPLYQPFVWIFREYLPGMVFSGHKRRLELGTVFNMGQMEGVTLTSLQRGFLSSERVNQLGIPARLYQLDISGYLFSPGLGKNSPASPSMQIRNINGAYYLSSVSNTAADITYSIYNASGALVCQGKDTLPCFIRCIPDTAGYYVILVGRQDQPQAGQTILELMHQPVK